MEMIDVLTKLKEIADKKPELVKDAVENVEKTNPKVDESRMKDYLHSEAEKMSREAFLKKHGESLRGFYNAIMGSEDDDDDRPDSMEGKEMKKENSKETVKEDMHITTDSPQEASMLMQILKMAGIQFKIDSNQSISVIYEKNSLNFGEIINYLSENNIKILDIITEDGDLEDVFVQLTNK